MDGLVKQGASYTARDASRLSGATLSQIENLVRTGVVRPQREALRRCVSRLYSLRGVAEIAIAAQLMDVGVPVRALQLVIETIRAAWRENKAVLALSRGTPQGADFSAWTGLNFMRPQDVTEWLDAGHSGIVVNLRAILERLEAESGDTLDERRAS